MKNKVAFFLSFVFLFSFFTGFSASAFAADYSLTCPRCGQVSLQLSEALRAGSTKRDVYTCEKCGAQIDKGTLLGCVSWYKVEGGTPAGSLTTPKRYYGSGQNTGGTYYYNSGNTTQTSIVNNNTFNTVTNNTWTSYQIQNTYYNNTYNYYKYETTNNYTYYVTYSPTYVNIYGHDSADGESTANDTDSQLYYSLPDGRNSFYCTPSDVFGTSYLYNVKNADLVLEDDGKTLGLWHLDGNFYDSSNWGHHATSSSYWFMDLGWNGGFRYSMNSMFNGPLVFPYDTSSLGSSDYWEIEFRVFISGGHGRAVFPFCFTAGGASRYANILTDQWSTIRIQAAKGPITNGWGVGVIVNGQEAPGVSASTASYCFSISESAFTVLNDTGGYCDFVVIDEVRVSKGRSWSFPIASQPYDSNMVYVYPESAVENDVVVQSALNVSSYRVGSARPTYPSNGTVFINVDKNVVKNIMQYDGGLWKDVNAAIYKNGEWFNLMNFDLAPITSSEDEIPPVTDGEDPGDSESGSSPGDSSDSDDKVNILEKIFSALANIIFSAIDFISAVASKLLDGLASLITSLIDSFTNLMNLGGEFGNFLAALWPFMPPEITAVLLLGFTLSILLMVISFFKK